MELNLELSAEEVKKLDDAINMGLSFSGMGIDTYVLRKLLYGLVRRIPEKKRALITTTERIDRQPDGYLYLEDDPSITVEDDGNEVDVPL